VTREAAITQASVDQHSREHQVVMYADRLWGARAKGTVCLAFGSAPHLDENGKYAHSSFKQAFLLWPTQLNEIVRRVTTASATGDVYVTPALRTERSRRSGTARSGRWLWVDVDGEWTDEREARWQRFAGTGAFMVHSGRGRHLYVPARREMEPVDIEANNRKLCALFGGEKWEANALLRMPGTLNWKPYAMTGAPAVDVTLYEPL
jgi:hypothetical protein